MIHSFVCFKLLHSVCFFFVQKKKSPVEKRKFASSSLLYRENLIHVFMVQKKRSKSCMNENIRTPGYTFLQLRCTMKMVLRQIDNSTEMVGKDQLLMGPVSLLSVNTKPSVIAHVLVRLKEDGLNCDPDCHSVPVMLWRQIQL